MSDLESDDSQPQATPNQDLIKKIVQKELQSCMRETISKIVAGKRSFPDPTNPSVALTGHPIDLTQGGANKSQKKQQRTHIGRSKHLVRIGRSTRLIFRRRTKLLKLYGRPKRPNKTTCR